jgi:Flp pilus assembly pilin Flp
VLQAFLKDDSGTTVIEYGLIAGLVSIVIFAALLSLGNSVDTAYTSVNDSMVAAIGTPPPSDTPGDVVQLTPILDKTDITATR